MIPTPMQATEHSLQCTNCKALCCRYLAMEIDKPTCKRDYDNIRWYLKHRDVHVFIDNHGDWLIQFDTPCDELNADHRCGNYDHRPMICRQHGDDDFTEQCEFDSDDETHVHRFSTAEEFEAWLTQKGIDWRFKNGLCR